ncbi:MAG TPA: thiamine pyrophosphate-dependent dehydrogenase E1 component subunit alpha [Syntrophomonadaceae bacterium]|nr:thiamine pyrophosphate-dependent dehydrogenase E1 component subunit alpha [Syntrophomonadaceae bacterium]
MDLNKEQLLAFYKNMVTIRAFESKAVELFAAGQIPGFVHLYLGEEAIATGVCACLEKTDYIASTHRGHGHLISKGGNLNFMMAELFGRTTGYCKGKGGSMHIADVDLGILGANGIVGAGMPIATGAAFACKYKENGAVAVAFFGDGASDRATFHESLNLASIWKLPVVFVCENNGWAISNAQKDHQNVTDISDRATAYGIPGVSVDGNDVIAVFEAADAAIERARRGDGPTLVECKSWRWRGHFEGDPGAYKDPKDQEEWLAKDPIPRLEKNLLKLKYATKAELDKITAAAQEEIEAAIKFAGESPQPDPQEVLTDVYAD